LIREDSEARHKASIKGGIDMDESVVSGLREMRGPIMIVVAAQIVFFAAGVFVLRKLLLSDTLKAVGRMKDSEATLAKKEEVMQEKMAEHDREFARKKAESEEELERKREAQEQDVTRLKERMKNEAKAEADKIISEAQLGKDKIREELVREMDGKAVEFAGELFKLVVTETVTEKMNMAFIDELMTALSEVDAASIHVDASETEFTSSHPMDPAQKAGLESLLNEKFGVDVTIDEKVDASLLAGIAIKLGSLEIDGSLLNRYKEGVAEITKHV
jgi:F0F1-type ATP synthase delta subunit